MKVRRLILLITGALLVVCLVLAGVSALLNRNLPTQSAVVDHLGDAEKARLAEFFQVRQQLGDTVWSGWDTADIPVLEPIM